MLIIPASLSLCICSLACSVDIFSLDHLKLNVQECSCIYRHMMEEAKGGTVTADPQLLETDDLLQTLLDACNMCSV